MKGNLSPERNKNIRFEHDAIFVIVMDEVEVAIVIQRWLSGELGDYQFRFGPILPNPQGAKDSGGAFINSKKPEFTAVL